MRRPLTVVAEFGFCGFGTVRVGTWSIMQIGVVTLTWWRGSLLEELKRNQEALAMAASTVGKAAEKVRGVGA